jgi:TPR repeat protein
MSYILVAHHKRKSAMKRSGLMIVLCLLTGMAMGDFEIQDPSQPVEDTGKKIGEKSEQQKDTNVLFHVETMMVFAEMGVADAEFQVGTMYNLGQGLSQDDSAAVDWYRKAAVQGHKVAQFYLGRMYLDGRGVHQDYDEAYIWLSIASFEYEAPVKYRDMAASKLSAKELEIAKHREEKLFEYIFLENTEE